MMFAPEQSPFAVHPVNQAFLDGREPRPTIRRFMERTGLVFIGVLGAIGMIAIMWPAVTGSPSAGTMDCALLWLLIVLVVGAILGRRVWRAQRLVRHGQLLDGRVNQARLQSTASEYGGVDCILLLDYSFVTPVGRTIQNKLRLARQDLIGQGGPQPGTPIKVLYLHDRLYEPV